MPLASPDIVLIRNHGAGGGWLWGSSQERSEAPRKAIAGRNTLAQDREKLQKEEPVINQVAILEGSRRHLVSTHLHLENLLGFRYRKEEKLSRRLPAAPACPVVRGSGVHSHWARRDAVPRADTETGTASLGQGLEPESGVAVRTAAASGPWCREEAQAGVPGTQPATRPRTSRGTLSLRLSVFPAP